MTSLQHGTSILIIWCDSIGSPAREHSTNASLRDMRRRRRSCDVSLVLATCRCRPILFPPLLLESHLTDAFRDPIIVADCLAARGRRTIASVGDSADETAQRGSAASAVGARATRVIGLDIQVVLVIVAVLMMICEFLVGWAAVRNCTVFIG